MELISRGWSSYGTIPRLLPGPLSQQGITGPATILSKHCHFSFSCTGCRTWWNSGGFRLHSPLVSLCNALPGQRDGYHRRGSASPVAHADVNVGQEQSFLHGWTHLSWWLIQTLFDLKTKQTEALQSILPRRDAKPRPPLGARRPIVSFQSPKRAAPPGSPNVPLKQPSDKSLHQVFTMWSL